MGSEGMLFSLDEIVRATGGSLLPVAASARETTGGVNSVVIDSRQCRAGTLFVPLSGERTDGHRFLENAH